MKIKVPSGLLTIDILTVLLLMAVALVPSTSARFILGVPLLLFFPGYALLSAMFVDKKGMDAIEQIALSCVISIAVVALIGYGLNYTAWGIKLWPGLVAVAGFVLLASAVALVRRAHSLHQPVLMTELDLRLPGWKPRGASGALFIVLIIAVLASLGALAYVWGVLPARETFTEFYILGINGKAEDYPTEFVMQDGQTTQVRYSTGSDQPGKWGEVTLVIANHEQKTVTYSVTVRVDGQKVNVMYNGATVNDLENINLKTGNTWQGTIGFSPLHTGANQEVEFLLFKNGTAAPADSLHLWVDATALAGP